LKQNTDSEEAATRRVQAFLNSPIYRAPLKITGYLCVVCGKHHSSKSKPFINHYAKNEKHYGWTPLNHP